MLLPRTGTSAGGAAAKSAVERCDEPFHFCGKQNKIPRAMETPPEIEAEKRRCEESMSDSLPPHAQTSSLLALGVA